MTVRRAWDLIDAAYERYKPLFFLLAVVALAFGFEFRTPRRHFSDLRAADAELRARQDSIRTDHLEIERYLRALAVAECLDRPEREWRLMGLPCERLLAGASPVHP